MALPVNVFYENYLLNPLNPEEKKDLADNREALIGKNCFENELAFGTGGVREIVEHGTNRLNRFNMARLNLALTATLRESIPNSPLIIIAYDSRLTSTDFAWQSYHILKSRGLRVKIFQRPAPTPLLSFAVALLEADAGIVLTASHNPPEYNGFKVYGNDGAQIVSPMDAVIEKNYRDISYAKMLNFPDLYNFSPPELSDVIENEISDAYLSALKSENFVTAEPKNISILYSPLHGTGGWIFEKIFNALNFTNFKILTEQALPDGDFPTVKSPNPEEPAAFKLLLDNGRIYNSEILLASDPDADRIGAAIRSGDSYKLLTGNQICVLLLDFLIRKKMPGGGFREPYVCKTIVTSDLVQKIAVDNNIRVVEVLTGFKNIAAAIKNDPENYIFGGEESFGYLPVNWVRDKDSISSAVALCEMASTENLQDTLEKLYLKYGYYHDHAFSIKISGGEKQRKDIIDKLNNPREFISRLKFSRQLVDCMDLRDAKQLPGGDHNQKLKKQLGKAEVVKYFFDPDATITIRPSGTEPKIKIYIGLKSARTFDKDSLPGIQKELADEALFLQREIAKLLESQEKLC
ncbi:MAG: phospho-sugar mutase [Spirochaetia bacterium]|nr:phospho-sugar mutase [Spirochaetia bacterium]